MQYKIFFDKNKKLEIAKFFVKSKLENFTKYFNSDFSIFINNLYSTNKLAEILNLEALATKEIYKILRSNFKKYNITFLKRDYNPPKDPGNALISFIYTLFYNLLVPYILKENFDPFISFLHVKRGKHKAFISDCMEIVRPILLKKLMEFLDIYHQELRFVKIKEAYYLSNDSIKLLLNFLNDSMDEIFEDFLISVKELKRLFEVLNR